jgi:hypothetical protein
MKIMNTHVSATAREQKPQVNQTTRTATIINALKQRAQSVLNDESIDAQSRAIVRYALETNDPWLAELVRRAAAGERIVDTIDFPQTSEAKIEALAEVICRSGDEPAAALLVLMATLENAANPNELAHTAKHLAFTRCGELNVYGAIDAQIAIVEGKLLATDLVVS